MFFDPVHTMKRLLEAIPQPGRQFVRPAHDAPEVAAPGCGCCPACHEFVRVRTPGPKQPAVCPSCGRTIRSLDPLGSPRSLGATNEL